MKSLTKCPKCGQQFNHWNEIPETIEIDGHKEERVKGYICQVCLWKSGKYDSFQEELDAFAEEVS